MKISHVVILSALVGSALGTLVTWANFGGAPTFVADADQEQKSPAAGRPQVSVDSTTHDFGPIERGRSVSHVFRFANVGNAPLTLKAGTTTCTQCTISRLERSTLAPGESAEVVVEYIPTESKPTFKQIAPILTNDPEKRRVELNIMGTVTSRFRVLPDTVTLGKVSAAESKSADIKVLAYFADEVRLVRHEFLLAGTASHFDATSEPIPADQLIEDGAKSGLRVTLTLKPGLPLGPIAQTIRLELEFGQDPQKIINDVAIEGEVDSDISIVGPGWNQQQARLNLGKVKSKTGTARKLFVLVRGEHRDEVKVTPAKVEPGWLKVSLGEPLPLASGTVTQIPLTIEIPPGQPPVNYLGNEAAKHAEIVLDTTHPQVKQIQLLLRFAIEP